MEFAFDLRTETDSVLQQTAWKMLTLRKQIWRRINQYKFFIGTAQKMQKVPNLGTDADGTVTLKMTE